jgi:lysophospholipid acyltransferase (LPLAT)-like uncharacterized protein
MFIRHENFVIRTDMTPNSKKMPVPPRATRATPLHWLAGVAARWVLAPYYTTIRIVEGPELRARMLRHPRPAGVYAFWHSHQLSALWHFRRVGAGILISASKDGEYIARVARSVGFTPLRGSSSRLGAAGLKALIEFARSGRPVAITPDGPRGPRYSIGAGALALAQKSGYPIVPFAIGLSSFWELPSWDRFRIPKPFSRGYACWGEPLSVPPGADDEALDRLAAELRARMIELEKFADRMARDQGWRRG